MPTNRQISTRGWHHFEHTSIDQKPGCRVISSAICHRGQVSKRTAPRDNTPKMPKTASQLKAELKAAQDQYYADKRGIMLSSTPSMGGAELQSLRFYSRHEIGIRYAHKKLQPLLKGSWIQRWMNGSKTVKPRKQVATNVLPTTAICGIPLLTSRCQRPRSVTLTI